MSVRLSSAQAWNIGNVLLREVVECASGDFKGDGRKLLVQNGFRFVIFGGT